METTGNSVVGFWTWAIMLNPKSPTRVLWNKNKAGGYNIIGRSCPYLGDKRNIIYGTWLKDLGYKCLHLNPNQKQTRGTPLGTPLNSQKPCAGERVLEGMLACVSAGVFPSWHCTWLQVRWQAFPEHILFSEPSWELQNVLLQDCIRSPSASNP